MFFIPDEDPCDVEMSDANDKEDEEKRSLRRDRNEEVELGVSSSLLLQRGSLRKKDADGKGEPTEKGDVKI